MKFLEDALILMNEISSSSVAEYLNKKHYMSITVILFIHGVT